ncbi:unnamed protein product [Nyctereutes procyonoides]|uniref:(raccoon dog) hypothetical protein n=1 Tax=Nyctereutes procyonoides TaxID=34880 RepID=A0A811ZDC4_NYCPR|nr:unnamed protein product [Nyctereutes procyonoides]
MWAAGTREKLLQHLERCGAPRSRQGTCQTGPQCPRWPVTRHQPRVWGGPTGPASPRSGKSEFPPAWRGAPRNPLHPGAPHRAHHEGIGLGGGPWGPIAGLRPTSRETVLPGEADVGPRAPSAPLRSVAESVDPNIRSGSIGHPRLASLLAAAPRFSPGSRSQELGLQSAPGRVTSGAHSAAAGPRDPHITCGVSPHPADHTWGACGLTQSPRDGIRSQSRRF